MGEGIEKPKEEVAAQIAATVAVETMGRVRPDHDEDARFLATVHRFSQTSSIRQPL